MPAFRPALRDSVLVLEDEPDRLQFVVTSSSTSKTFAVDPMTRRLIPLLNGTRTIAELQDELADAPGYDPGHLVEVLDALDQEALLAIAPDTPAQPERYHRQLDLLEEFAREDGLPHAGAELQTHLRNATVAVIGTGGLGAWLLASLTAAGVGRLLVADLDRVAPSDLNRQVLFTAQDVGRLRTEAVTDRLEQLDPDVEVETRALGIEGPDHVLELAQKADLVINCADRPSVAETSDWVSTACLHTATPHIVGAGYAYHVGSLGLTVLPGETACWQCARDTVRARTHAAIQGPGPSLAMFSAVVANLLAWDAVRVLLGLRPGTADRLGEFDFRTLEVRWREVPRRLDCSACA